jgi:hypothetical protein
MVSHLLSRIVISHAPTQMTADTKSMLPDLKLLLLPIYLHPRYPERLASILMCVVLKESVLDVNLYNIAIEKDKGGSESYRSLTAAQQHHLREYIINTYASRLSLHGCSPIRLARSSGIGRTPINQHDTPSC